MLNPANFSQPKLVYTHMSDYRFGNTTLLDTEGICNVLICFASPKRRLRHVRPSKF